MIDQEDIPKSVLKALLPNERVEWIGQPARIPKIAKWFFIIFLRNDIFRGYFRGVEGRHCPIRRWRVFAGRCACFPFEGFGLPSSIIICL